MGVFKFEEKTVSFKCLECGRDYEDTQILINGVPCCKFRICPECKEKVIEAVLSQQKQPEMRNIEE